MIEPISITEELLQKLIRKYITIFMNRSPNLQLRVFRTFSGRPPIDDVPEELRPLLPNAVMVSGLFFNIDDDYRIGINKNLIIPAQLMTFFHEYGHACYKRESSEPIDNHDALIRTETAAILSSLRLADDEGLLEVAHLAIQAAKIAASMGDVYQTALDNAMNHPLWIKYSQKPST